MTPIEDLRRRLPPDAVVVFPSGADAGLRWREGPIDLLIVGRGRIGAGILSSALATWMTHVATGGFLCLVGWKAVEDPGMPPPRGFSMPGGRAWIPVLRSENVVAYQCVGVITECG